MASSNDTLNQHFAQCTLLMITESQTSSIPCSQGESRAPRSIAHHPSRPMDVVLKGQRSASPLQLRCKKSPNPIGAGLHFPPRQQPAVASVTRRNERERNRVRQVNAGFQTLRQHVPNGAANGKLSKVETLRSAVEYIRALQLLLDESNNAVSAGFQSSDGVPSPSGSSGSPQHSTCSSSVEEGAIYEHWSPEEQEIIDFTTWIHRY